MTNIILKNDASLTETVYIGCIKKLNKFEIALNVQFFVVVYRRGPQICLLDRAGDLKHFCVYFIKIGQGNQKLLQFENENFNLFFGRAT